MGEGLPENLQLGDVFDYYLRDFKALVHHRCLKTDRLLLKRA